MKNYTERIYQIMDMEMLDYKKILFIFGIILLSVTTYLYFTPNKFNFRQEKFNFRQEKISIEEPQTPSIGGFYHFSTINTPWKHIVHEQMLLAHVSGLIDASTNVYITGLGNIKENQSIYNIFTDSKFIYEYDSNITLYEFPTLKKLEKFCLYHNNSFVWYAHSKGASHATDFVADWRAVLNYFVLDNWYLCYKLLFSTNYTTCGSVLIFDSINPVGRNIYYGGNMWWAKCSHINQLTRLEKLNLANRYEAEWYVTSKPYIEYFNCLTAGPHTSWYLNRETADCTVNQPPWKVR